MSDLSDPFVFEEADTGIGPGTCDFPDCERDRYGSRWGETQATVVFEPLCSIHRHMVSPDEVGR